METPLHPRREEKRGSGPRGGPHRQSGPLPGAPSRESPPWRGGPGNPPHGKRRAPQAGRRKGPDRSHPPPPAGDHPPGHPGLDPPSPSPLRKGPLLPWRTSSRGGTGTLGMEGGASRAEPNRPSRAPGNPSSFRHLAAPPSPAGLLGNGRHLPVPGNMFLFPPPGPNPWEGRMVPGKSSFRSSGNGRPQPRSLPGRPARRPTGTTIGGETRRFPPPPLPLPPPGPGPSRSPGRAGPGRVLPPGRHPPRAGPSRSPERPGRKDPPGPQGTGDPPWPDLPGPAPQAPRPLPGRSDPDPPGPHHRRKGHTQSHGHGVGPDPKDLPREGRNPPPSHPSAGRTGLSLGPGVPSDPPSGPGLDGPEMEEGHPRAGHPHPAGNGSPPPPPRRALPAGTPSLPGGPTRISRREGRRLLHGPLGPSPAILPGRPELPGRPSLSRRLPPGPGHHLEVRVPRTDHLGREDPEIPGLSIRFEPDRPDLPGKKDLLRPSQAGPPGLSSPE